MSSIWDFLSQHLGTIVFGALGAVIVWGVSKLHLNQQLHDAITAFTKRALDKAQDWYQLAVATTGDGGTAITKAEMSVLRQKVWELLQEELAGGPLLSLLKLWGEEKVKGLISIALAKMGVKAIEAPPSPTGT